jgi:molybdopterin converting factor small subunit
VARVRLWGSLAARLGVTGEIAVQAGNVRELLDRLRERYPEIAAQLDRGVSVSIDGELHSNALHAPIGPDSEVVLLPRIVGG